MYKLYREILMEKARIVELASRLSGLVSLTLYQICVPDPATGTTEKK